MVNFTTCSILLFLILITTFLQLCCCQKAYPNVSCITRERRALLQLRSSLVDKSNRLSSWRGEDCCKWEAVGCSRTTGHVVKLDLCNPILYDGDRDSEDPKYSASYWNSCLAGEINPSILALKYLNHLDFSSNNFSGRKIPVFFGSLKNLKYLNLSNSGFEGEIPYHLGNLSRLQHLDVSGPHKNLLTSKSLSWVSKLHSLKSLNLSLVNLSEAQDWFQEINMLPSLMSLELVSCALSSPSFPNLPQVNLTSLTSLDLSYNYFNSTIPLWLFNITSLTYLNLSFNNFHGSIPGTLSQMNSLGILNLRGNYITDPLPNSFDSLSSLDHLDLSLNNFGGLIPFTLLRNLTSLRVLDLSSNVFHGAIPREIGSLTQLNKLDLSKNKLNGTVSPNLGLLRELHRLDISSNSLMGEIFESHFAKLQKLKFLHLSYSSLALNISSSWIPPFQLQYIGMDYVKIGPRFPLWLQTHKKLAVLGMRNTSISDNMPEWFETVHSSIFFLDLSTNNITGKVPNFKEQKDPTNLSYLSGQVIVLGSNKFEGIAEQFPSSIKRLDISKNALAGGIPLPEDSTKALSWKELNFNDNYFNGSIPNKLCHSKSLTVLDLSNNQLSGRLPLCLGNLQNLIVLNVGNNSLYGQIPWSLGSLKSLRSLHLNNNKFQGQLPPSLQYLKDLRFLDMGENKLEGVIPAWMGPGLTKLIALRLQSNTFSGDVPSQLCQLSNLRVLNLAQNNLTGSIPHCFNNFSGMINHTSSPGNDDMGNPLFWSAYFSSYKLYFSLSFIYYDKKLLSFMSGRELKFSVVQNLTLLDLSQNHIIGEIPEELMDLVDLRSLRLSSNHLTGNIPRNIGNLRELLSLDLSINELSGSIPPSLVNLNFLNYLNLSSNKLSGRIPTGNQLQTLDDPSIYAGNSGLCGKPLSSNCSDEKLSRENGPSFEHKDDKQSTFSWFCAGLGPGFAIGFLGSVSIVLF